MLMWLAFSFGALALVGWAALWARRMWLKALAYALLIVCVGWFATSALGLPRPFWPFGVTTGTLIGVYPDMPGRVIYLWVLHKGTPTAVEVPFSMNALKQLQEEQAKHAKEPVHIGKGGTMMAKRGNHHGDVPYWVPFVAYPEPWQPGPPKTENYNH